MEQNLTEHLLVKTILENENLKAENADLKSKLAELEREMQIGKATGWAKEQITIDAR